MKLHAAIESYVSLKRALGADYSSEARVLRSFARFAKNVDAAKVRADVCRDFCRCGGQSTRYWAQKHYVLRRFFTFLVARGHLATSPLPEPGPKIIQSWVPYIYSQEEVQRLLNATTILENPRSPLQARTFRTLLLVLYAAGLRSSEALRLKCCDVDLGERILAICGTKFFKSRLVPIGTDLVNALASYRVARQRLPMVEGPNSAFFASRTGHALSLARLEKVFGRLRAYAAIRRPQGPRWQPRLHDLRHTFAVHRLIAWYREGADVQACLPLLATYLGHVHISGTQAYLTMTPELLAEAARRFERYASPQGEGDIVCVST
jgi:integrase/recombinase XerD